MTTAGSRRQKHGGKPAAHLAPSAASALFHDTAKAALLYGLLLAVATLALYWPVSGHPFLNYDDDIYVLYNPHVAAGLHWETVSWAFTSFDASNWHPLTWLSHAFDCQMFALNPRGHHRMSLLLHVVNALVLLWVLWRATGSAGRSAMVAAFFALHPINVESVAWIAERKNVLSMLFVLLALGAYRWYVSRPTAGRYAVVALLFALALMCKPQVISFPFVLLLWDYWPLRRMFADDRTTRFSALVLEKAPLFVLSAASAVITMVAQHRAGAMSGPQFQPFPSRLGNAIVAYVRYLGKAFWPSELSLVYPHPGSSLRIWQVVASLVLLLAITGLVFALRSRQRYLVVGWLWFVGTLVPMIGVVQVGMQAMADRYAYLPFVGLFVMVVWGVADLARELRVPAGAQATACFAVLLAVAAVTHRQLDYWSDNVKLWTHALESDKTPTNWVAENNLAHALLSQGDEDQALQHFLAAVVINPADPDSNLNVGAYEQGHKDLAGAIAQYQRVIAITQSNVRLTGPTRAQAFRNMGLAYRDLGDYPRAAQSFQSAVTLNPDDSETWINLGAIEQKTGDAAAAAYAFTQALRIQPADWTYLLLAQSLQQSGRPDEARAALQKAKLMTANLEQAQRVADHVLSLQP